MLRSQSTAPRYRLAVFDFDGTLADSLPWLVAVLDDLADRFGFAKLERDELESLRGLDGRAILKRLELPMWKLPRVAAHVRTLAARDAHRVPLFDGARAALHELSASGLELAVVSSNDADNIRRALGPDTAASIRWFECGASLFGKPAKLRKVLAKSGCAPAEAIYVGDELRDADAAAAVGMSFGAVTWGYNEPAALRARNPAEIFETIDQIAAKLARQ